MRSPALGLAFTIYQKHRLGFAVASVYFVLLAAATRFLDSPSSEGVLVAPFGFVLLYLMAVFANSDADLSSTRSGYPSHLFNLPVRTRALVLYPMAYGILTVVVAYLAFAILVLAPHMAGTILWWPATLLAALMACLQAFSWYPVPLPYLRGVLAFGLLAALTCLATLGPPLIGLSPLALSAIYLTIIPFAAYFAIRGVSSAREGRSLERTWLPEQRKHEGIGRDRFTSVAQAQLWFEWKRNGVVLPLLSLLICLSISIPTALVLHDAVAAIAAAPPLGAGRPEVVLVAHLWFLCLIGTPLMAIPVGCCPYKEDTFRPDFTLQPFLATRPLSNVGIVLAKMRMAALSTISAWAVIGVFLAGWLLWPAPGSIGNLGALMLPYVTLKSVFVAGLILLGLIICTWGNLVLSLWVQLSGRRGVIFGWSVGIPLFLTLLIARAVNNLSDGRTFLARTFPHLPALALGLAVLKVCVVIGAVIALRRYQLLPTSTLARIICVYLFIGTGLWAILMDLLPKGIVSAGYAAIGVFLFLPLSRLLIAPLALHWNRCR